MLDLLADMLDQAKRRGATSCDAFVVGDQSFSAQVRLGQVDTVKYAREQHLSLRVFVGKSVAAASTSDLSGDSVARLVEEAVSLARITSPDELSGLPDADLLARDLPQLDLSDPTGHDLDARGQDRAGAPRGSGGPRGRPADQELRRRRLLRPPRPLRLCDEPRVRGGVRDLVVLALGVAGGIRGRRDAAGWLVPRDPQARAARRPGGDRAHRGEAGASPARGEAGEDRGGARRVRSRDGGEPGPAHRGRGLGSVALPRRVLPRGQARPGHRDRSR